ncbi:shikimate dehydrogenase [Desulfopila sp. IMCC35008]|uniref:shikimate dehydrogenase n=1 Tax=Desulfopila sp. IMCC35008 TaxID=2653858 RepID=UPI0013D1CA3E|nr:shikimate dehydrogenase [Desulfopila sp. IMCC35008]
MQINGETLLYGIIGNPVRHSLSPLMHNRAFQALGINSVYVPFPVTDVESAITGVRGLGIGGTSVTIPHKQSIMAFLDYIDPVAEKIGAVNTIVGVQSEGRTELHGMNTDWLGANRALELEISLAGKEVILLGAGGSARAIGFGLIEAGAGVTICSRTEQRGRDLAAVLACDWVSLHDVDSLSGDILVNATSVGMHPHENATLVAKESLCGYRVVMDIVYSPLTTRLLKEAAEAGCAIVSGLEMLLYQGVAQFELWTGRNAPVELMRDTLLNATANK